MTERDDDVDWALLRRLYETGVESVRGLERRFGLSKDAVGRRVRREGWTRPAEGRAAARRQLPTDPDSLVRALQRTAARLVEALENRVVTADEEVDEKDVRALGALAGTLAKVIDLATTERRPRDRPTADVPAAPAGGSASLDFDDPAVLDALSQRLERLAAERTGRLPEAAQPDGEGDVGKILAAVRAERSAAAGG